MNERIYVGNLNYSCTHHDLTDLAEQFGQVREVDMPKDYMTDTFRGFAFVTCRTAHDAEKIIRGLDGLEHLGRVLVANIAKPRPTPTGRNY